MLLKKYAFIISILTVSILGLGGCNYFETENPEAVYLTIDSVGFNQTLVPSITDQRIEDIYVYADGKLLGAYQVPFTIPVTDLSKKRISLLAGVYADGIRNARVQYPFFATIDSTFTWEVGKNYRMRPVFNYVPYLSTPFKFSENFERGFTMLDTFQSTGAKIKIRQHTNLAFKAGETSYLEVSSDTSIAVLLQVASEGELPTVDRSRPTYLEFQFQSNYDMIVGVLVKEPGSEQWIPAYNLYLKPSDSWKKVYCTLDDEVASAPSGSKYKIFFRSAHGGGTDSTYYRLDNVRLMTYN
jgi:hypothetical protein